jgi:hypothetical protein
MPLPEKRNQVKSNSEASLELVKELNSAKVDNYKFFMMYFIFYLWDILTMYNWVYIIGIFIYRVHPVYKYSHGTIMCAQCSQD